MLNLRRIHYLVTLADAGSFSRAAARVGVGQPAFGRAIATLERELGHPLVDRSGHRVSLTPYAEALVRRGRRLLLEAREAERDLELVDRGELGNLRLGLIANFAYVLTTPLLTMAARLGPRAKVRLETGRPEALLGMLRVEELDLVVTDGRAVPPDGLFRVMPLARVPIAAFVRPGHPLLGQPSVGLPEVLRFPVVGPASSSQIAATLVELFGARGYPDEIISLQCESIDRGLEVARASDALLALNVVAAAAAVERGDLIPLPIDGIESLFGHPAIIRSVGRTTTPLLRQVEALIHEHLGTEAVARAKAVVAGVQSGAV